jgi:aminopeptidase
MSVVLSQYAKLLVQYCLHLNAHEKVLIRTTPLAEPLLRPLYQQILRVGAHPEFLFTFEDQQKIFYDNASIDTLNYISPFYKYAVEHFDAILSIDAPYNKDLQHVDPHKQLSVQKARSGIKQVFMNRSASKQLKWTSCIYPTATLADNADMSLPEFEQFVFDACFLMESNPIHAWERLGGIQGEIVSFLNYKRHFRIIGPHTDITFSTENRLWQNSDGKRNMPSGEVFTSPVEESVNGKIYFSYPTIYNGKNVEGISLEVENGIITRWTAKKGKDVLDHVFSIPGARQFGEVAIGTNKRIKKATRNILFDEKIGGSIHMAIGSSYPETGGKNVSAIHWDMITTMSEGQIIADDELIYENGRFKNKIFNL